MVGLCDGWTNFGARSSVDRFFAFRYRSGPESAGIRGAACSGARWLFGMLTRVVRSVLFVAVTICVVAVARARAEEALGAGSFGGDLESDSFLAQASGLDGTFAGASGLYGEINEALPAPPEEPNADFLNVDVSAGGAKAAAFEEQAGGGPDDATLADLEKLAARAAEEEGLVYLGDGPPPAYSFGYNRVKSALTWIPGGDDDFGWLSYESFGGAQMNRLPSLVTGFGVHFLDGPVRTDMPPRLFDFSIGLKDRRLVRPHIGYDIEFRVGAFSDFEGSAEDGVRYPSHAVTFFRFNRRLEFVLGVDYLDRDDIRLLPVAGTIWTPRDWLRVEAVFPRPRLATRIMDSSHWLFLGGELGGGTWAVERNFPAVLQNTIRFDDNATYRDLRLMFGWESVHEDSLSSSLEVGYVFERRLSYSRDLPPILGPRGDYEPGDGWMVRMTARY
jgi:hypothetical protein